jgi:PST family polysaccharide transporter
MAVDASPPANLDNEPTASRVGIGQKIRSAALWSAIAALASRLFSLVVIAILGRLLDRTDFGLVALAGVVINLLQTFAVQGFSEALIQRERIDKEHINAAFWLNIVAGALMTIVGILAASAIADFFHEPRLAPIVAWLSLSFIVYAISAIERTMMMRELNFRLPSTLAVVSEMMGGAVGVGMAYVGSGVLIGGVVGISLAHASVGVWSLVGQMLAARLSFLVLCSCYTSWRPGLTMSWSAIKDLYGFGMNILALRTIEFLLQKLPDVVIKFLFGTDALGVYTIAGRLPYTISQTTTGVVGNVAFAAASRLQSDRAGIRRGFLAASEHLAVITLPLFVGFALIAPWAVPVLFGDKWDDSIPLAQWLTVTTLVQATTLYLSINFLQGLGSPNSAFRLNLAFMILQMVGFSTVYATGQSLVIFCASTAVMALLAIPICIFFLRDRLQITLVDYLVAIRAPALAAAGMAMAVAPALWLTAGRLHPLAILVLALTLGGGAYIASLFVIKPAMVKRLLSEIRPRVFRTPSRLEH